MYTCVYCDNHGMYRDFHSGAYLCLKHARSVVSERREGMPQSVLPIRSATSSDGSRIVELANYFWGETQVHCFGKCYQVEALPAYVACDGDDIVGVISFAREGDAVTLVMLHVLPQWHRQGIGKALIATVEEMARAEGVDRLIVATTNDDIPALGFYQHLGFVIKTVLVGAVLERHGAVVSGFADIPVRDEIQMELRL